MGKVLLISYAVTLTYILLINMGVYLYVREKKIGHIFALMKAYLVYAPLLGTGTGFIGGVLGYVWGLIIEGGGSIINPKSFYVFLHVWDF